MIFFTKNLTVLSALLLAASSSTSTTAFVQNQRLFTVRSVVDLRRSVSVLPSSPAPQTDSNNNSNNNSDSDSEERKSEGPRYESNRTRSTAAGTGEDRPRRTFTSRTPPGPPGQRSPPGGPGQGQRGPGGPGQGQRGPGGPGQGQRGIGGPGQGQRGPGGPGQGQRGPGGPGQGQRGPPGASSRGPPGQGVGPRRAGPPGVGRGPPGVGPRRAGPPGVGRGPMGTNQGPMGANRGQPGRGPQPGSGGNSLKLENPLKINRIMAEPQRRDQGDSRPPQRSGGGGRGARPSQDVGRESGGDSGGSGGPPQNKDFASRKKPPAKKGGAARGGGEDDRKKRTTSLRIGSGKRGRGAELSRRRGSLKKKDRRGQREARADAAIIRKTVFLPEGALTVSQLAEILDEKPIGLIKFLMTDLGVMASMTQNLDPATCVAVVEGFGLYVGGDEDFDDDYDDDSSLATGFAIDDADDPEDLVRRAPVVTIMGHVDHGKTSLLDAIRSTDVTSGEAGGITQAINAYQVSHKGSAITFIDTPGHEAFTDMRERGANVTDMVVLVVAADDGVKQQTADSIACARQAGVPIIVAINKCDLEAADPVKVQTELTSYDILTEDFGGSVLSCQISAKKKTNLNELLDKIMLLAEVEDLKANPNRDAEGIVVEANVVRGLGTVATTLIKRGTLRVGDIFVAGETHGRVKALISTSDNSRMKEAGPSTPVRVVGFEGVPMAGDIICVAKDEQSARDLAENRKRLARESSSFSYQSGLMESVTAAFGATKVTREMCVVVKADVQGSAEALTRALRELRLEDDEAVVTVKVLVSGTGEVSKSDIAIASVSKDTTVLAFSVAASIAAMDDARSARVPIGYYDIIYDAIESVESRMQEVLSPTPEGEYAGSAVVQEVFNIGGTGNIAGSRCKDGLLRKGQNVRVMRGDKILINSKIKTLRNFKAETDLIEEGNECGIGLLDFEAFQAGDIIECYVEK